MDITRCDICDEIIKPKDKSFVLAIDEKNKQLNHQTPQMFLQSYNNRLEQIEVKEVCVECKKVYDYIFFNMRIKDLQEIRETVKKMGELPTKQHPKDIDNEN